MRRLPLLLLVLFLFVPDAEARRRSVRGPSTGPDPSTVAGWLVSNAYAINSVELVPWDSDIQSIGHLIGNAAVIGLGDGTHGTHEFYTIKLRLIDYLVRERGFDILTFEAPVPHWQQLNEYVLGAAGDPRAVLTSVSDDLKYMFWDTEEILALVEWMRAYNLRRGHRRPVQLLGADVHGQASAWKSVVAYLRTADPVMAAEAEREYACVGDNNYVQTCTAPATRVHDALAAARERLIAASSENAFEVAMLAARVVVQGQTFAVTQLRDRAMAENVLWIRENRSATGRVMYWAHNAHSGTARMEFSSQQTAGQVLRTALGEDYWSLGTMTAAGSFLQWPITGQQMQRITATFPPLTEGMYEWYFKQRGVAALLIPLEGELPQWLASPARYNMAGNSAAPAKQPITLPDHFDAVIYIENTTPIRPLRPWPPS